MFKNRKKSSGKRPDEQRERDNSRMLDRYTDTKRADTTTSPPFRRASIPTGNFQYLKLTDGFNIVLSSDTDDPQSPPSSQRTLSSPDQTPSPRGRRVAKKKRTSQAVSGDTTGGEPEASDTGARKVDPLFQDQTEYVNVVITTSSVTDAVSRNERGESPGVSSDFFSIPEARLTKDSTEAGIPDKPLAASSEVVRTGCQCPEKDLSAVFSAGRADTHSPAHGSISWRKRSDKRIGDAGELTKEAQGVKGKRGESPRMGESVDKHTPQLVESGRGISRKTSQGSVLSPPEGAGHAEKTQHSFSILNDKTTARASEGDPCVSVQAEEDDTELNKASEPQAQSSLAATTSNNRPVTPHTADTAPREKPDTAQATDTTPTRHDTEDSSSCHDPSQADLDASSSRGENNSGTPELSQNVRTAAESGGHEHIDTGRSKAVSFKESLFGVGKKKIAKLAGDVSDAGKKHLVADMFRSNRHTLQAKNEPGEAPAVYRKLEDTGHTEAAADRSSASQGLHPCTAPASPDPTPEPPAQQPQPPGHLPTLSLTPPRPRPPGAAPKPRKNPPSCAYENWTINQAVTQAVTPSLDDEEDDDGEEVDSDNVSPGSSLDRHSAQGSKDSGLSVDVQHAVGVAEAGGGDGGGDGSVALSAEDGGVEGVRIQHAGGMVEEQGEGDAVDAMLDDSSAIYENTTLCPRPRGDGDSRAGTPEVPDSPDTRCRTASMVARLRHHDNQSLASTASEDDNKHDISLSADSSFDEDDTDNVPMSPSALENMEKMRGLLVKGVLETEKTYLAILELLLHYKRTLEASCRTSQPVISEEDIVCIFSNLQELRDIHKVFVEGLQDKVDRCPEQTVGDVFMGLVEKFPKFGAYAENYPTAVTTIHRCSQDNNKFQELAKQIVVTSTTREVTSLEDALFKPVQRLQRNTLVLYDLIKHTPKDHPDQETLQNALLLSQRNLENFGTSLVPRPKVEHQGHLVKSSFLVELMGGSRKLRYVFVFSKMLVCTKREQESRGGEVTFDCKWFIPMHVLLLDTKFTYQDDIKFSKRDEIEDLKKKLRGVKNEIKKELKKEEKQQTAPSLVPSRTVAKLQRKANELEGQLILASPRLPFKVWHDAGKAHTFLMTTDYEREEWRELLDSLQRQSTAEADAVPLSAFSVQEMVNSVRGLPEINEIGSVLIETEEEAIYGTLNVTVHKLTGLTEPCATYCCLEMDSYGHFFMKARTHISGRTTEPSWNADFELDLEGSQTLRVLCYRKGPDKQGDVLLCRGALEMTKAWRKGGSFQEKIVTMNEYSLVLSVCYTETEKTLRRTPVRQSGTAMFGVPIATCATREGKTVPTIVTACVQEVEKRGMKEMGIYRVSGVTSDVQKLKKHFDKNVKVGVSSLGEVEIHTVTSLLKLFLRELPDPVFTEASYPNFLDALKLNDKEGKEKCMLSLFYNLPDINYYTAVYLLEHLLRISRNEAENKMSIHNLSTIFGPTLLAPAPEKLALNVSQLMSLGAEHCMKQSDIIHHYLGLLARGASLRRSSAAATT